MGSKGSKPKVSNEGGDKKNTPSLDKKTPPSPDWTFKSRQGGSLHENHFSEDARVCDYEDSHQFNSDDDWSEGSSLSDSDELQQLRSYGFIGDDDTSIPALDLTPTDPCSIRVERSGRGPEKYILGAMGEFKLSGPKDVALSEPIEIEAPTEKNENSASQSSNYASSSEDSMIVQAGSHPDKVRCQRRSFKKTALPERWFKPQCALPLVEDINDKEITLK